MHTVFHQPLSFDKKILYYTPILLFLKVINEKKLINRKIPTRTIYNSSHEILILRILCDPLITSSSVLVLYLYLLLYVSVFNTFYNDNNKIGEYMYNVYICCLFMCLCSTLIKNMITLLMKFNIIQYLTYVSKSRFVNKRSFMLKSVVHFYVLDSLT